MKIIKILRGLKMTARFHLGPTQRMSGPLHSGYHIFMVCTAQEKFYRLLFMLKFSLCLFYKDVFQTNINI